MNKKNKIFVLALDGVPYNFLKEMIKSGRMPHLAEIVKTGIFKEMKSVVPPVSSSAWASFLTGKKPDEHGILSFTERNPSTMEWFTPDSRHLKVKSILEVLSMAGKRVFCMNVPVTFPPQPINGISICGFLGTDIEFGTFPEREGSLLKQKGYRIDANTELAKSDLAAFLKDLNHVLEKRIEMMWYYFVKEEWDFFMTHIMETDRLHHFTFEFFEKNDPVFLKIYEKFYSRLDMLIGKVVSKIDKETHLILLSDHGFTTLKQEVYLNRWLWENDYLRFTKPNPVTLADIHPDSKAYSLYPGRIFINLKRRENIGSVQPGIEYESLRGRLKEHLINLNFPVSNENVIKDIKNVEEVYDRKNIDSKWFADLFVFANDGYDLKGQLWNKSIFSKTFFNGMHTFDNAFLFTTGFDIQDDKISISDIANYIYKLLEINPII